MSTLAPGGADIDVTNGWQAYTPVLSGQTDNPVATYSVQIGRFTIVGALCFFNFKLTTTTMTKTTLTDLVSISLPLPAATLANQVHNFIGRIENGAAVANMIFGEIASAASTAQFRNYALAASSAQMTWAATTPGIGVLTNTINYNGSGFYEYAQS